jgi:hypothetical protein
MLAHATARGESFAELFITEFDRDITPKTCIVRAENLMFTSHVLSYVL